MNYKFTLGFILQQFLVTNLTAPWTIGHCTTNRRSNLRIYNVEIGDNEMSLKRVIHRTTTMVDPPNGSLTLVIGVEVDGLL